MSDRIVSLPVESVVPGDNDRQDFDPIALADPDAETTEYHPLKLESFTRSAQDLVNLLGFLQGQEFRARLVKRCVLRWATRGGKSETINRATVEAVLDEWEVEQ